MRYELLWALIAGAVLASAAACTSTTIVEPFYRPPDAQIEDAFVSPFADFTAYTKLMSRPLEIYYPDNAPAPSQDDLDRLRGIFREAFLAELGDDYEIVDEPGAGVMLVIAQIIDLKVLGPRGTYEPSGRLREVVARGQLTLLMELRDSVTGDVLGRAGEADGGSATTISDQAASWAQVEDAARRWARLFKRFLDANLG
jgi:hypothetical protein